LRRLSAEAALVDRSGARDHHARCAWLRASGRRSSSRRYPRQLFCVGLVGFAVRARGTAARMNALQLESGRLGASRFFTGDYSRSLQYARLTDALLRLRPFGTRQKNSVGPDALGVPRPCFAARETSENLQMISQRRKRLAFAPAASDVRFSDCVKRLFRSGIGAATALRPQSRWGHALWSGGVMATPTFCHALPTGATFASPGFACPLLWRRKDILARTRPLSN
jgi:hypothetical protein